MSKTIQNKLNEAFDKFGNRTAIRYGNKQISYEELDKRSNYVANSIFAKNIDRGSFIGVLLENKMDLIAVMIGILKAECVFLPLDPSYPKKRLKMMAEVSDLKYICVDNKAEEIVQSMFEQSIDSLVIKVDDLLEENAEQSVDRPITDYYENDSVYVYFTSGSTGKPKAIVGRNASLLQFIKWETETLGVNENYKVSQLTSQCHDPYLRDILVPLCSGAAVIIPPKKEVILDTESLIKWIDSEGINLIHCTPSLFRVFNSQDLKYGNFQDLKYILLAGEKINPAELINWYGIFSDRIQLINLYGPTETTLAKLFYQINPDDTQKLNIPIGKPIRGARAIIVDENMEICPPNFIGEIIIRTPNRTHGYYNNPEMNNEKFIVSPFNNDPNDIIYRTGDLGRMLPDGNIEFLGRIDRQVKIRGYRIELDEIENTLLMHEGIREAAVVDKTGKNGNPFLCAYIVKRDNIKELLIPELRIYLQERLPDYMIPRYFIKIDKMPLNPNGKLDYKSLPEPDGTSDEEYIPPRDDIEKDIERIWCELLEVEKVGINCNFMDVGGHSLNMMSLVSKIDQKFGVKIPLAQIFDNATIENIANIIRENEKSYYKLIEPVSKREYYETSSAQKRMFVLNQFEANNTTYNIPRVVLVEAAIDRERCRQVFDALVIRHETLRTSFEFIDGEPVQIIHDNIKFDINYAEVGEEGLDDAIKDFVKPFDLSCAPLFRFGLFKITDTKYALAFDIHHIISDGSSMNIIIKEFISLYHGRSLPKLRIQYKDFSVWQNNLFKEDTVKVMENYWLGVFSDEIPVLNMPTDYMRQTVQSYSGDRIEFSLGIEITQELKKLAKETKTTLYMILLAAYNVLLSKYTSQEDIVVGTPIAGRPNAELENIIGMFVNTLAIRNKPEGRFAFKEFLSIVKANALEAYKHQEYPFEELVNKLDLKRNLNRNSLVETMFTYQNTGSEVINIDGKKLIPYNIGDITSKFDFSLDAMEIDNDIICRLEYCIQLFRKETMQRFKEHFKNIIKQITQNYEIKLCDIEILDETEKEQIIYGFNRTKSEYPRDKVVQELFEEQAAKNPDRIAAEFNDKQVTYKDLNEKSNQIAKVLREKGVKPGDIVGIMAERSLEAIIIIMGIIKSGGAYMPIDHSYPNNRKEYLLKDSGAKILLTQKKLMDGIEFNGEIIDIEDEKLYQNQKFNVEVINKPSDLLYIIYTSGTTGRPKGVRVEHRNYVNITYAWRHEYSLEQDNIRLLQMASFSFDVFAGDLSRALLNGGRMIICPQETRLDVFGICSLIHQHEISIFESTPGLIIPLMNYIYENNISVDSLKLLILGSDVVPAEDFERLNERFGNKMRIINSYGVTEATIDSSYYEKRPENILYPGNVPIGKPLQNTKFYIVDKYKNILPIGVYGELYIGGDGISEGYHNMDDLTLRKFIPDTFEKGKKLYATGDLARWLPDGNVDFIGRIDNQVKIRGYRIELGEIESKLLSCEDINEAVVISKKDSKGINSLCAYVASEANLNPAQLKERLRKVIPEYMIPDHIIMMDKLPYTPNGKIDRRQLPEPAAAISDTYEPPRNELEEKLASIWSDVLGVKNIGINDNFFELGGHSIKAIEMLVKIEKLGYKLKINDIFQNQKIKELSEYMSLIKSNELLMSIPEAETEILKKFGIKASIIKYDVSGKCHHVMYLYTENTGIFDEITTFIKNNVSMEIAPNYIIFSDQKIACDSIHSISEDTFNELMNFKHEGSKNICKEYMDRVRDGQERLNREVTTQTVSRIYELSPVQKFSLKYRQNSGCVLRFNRYLDINLFEKAVQKLISSQGLMRSVLTKQKGELRWKEYNVPENIFLNFIDLSSNNTKLNKDIINTIFKEFYHCDYKKYDNLYYRIVLLRLNLKEHILVMPFEHIIFDVMSGEIIQNKLTRYYDDYENNRQREDEVKTDYLHYVKQVLKGPVGVSADDIISRFRLEEYKEYCKKLGSGLKRYKKANNTCFNFKIDYDFKEDQSDSKPWEISFALVNIFCKEFFGIDKVPIWTLTYGRQYEDNKYYDIVGEFVDAFPLIVDVDENEPISMVKSMKDVIAFISKHNINFSGMLFNEAVRKDYKYINKFIIGQLIESFVVFNFQGKFDEEELETDELEQGLDQFADGIKKLNRVSFIAKYSCKGIKISVMLPYNIKQQEMESFFNKNAKRVIELLEK